MSKYTLASLLFLCYTHYIYAFPTYNFSNYTNSSSNFNISITKTTTKTVTTPNDEGTIVEILITIFGFIAAVLLTTYCCWEWNDRNLCG